MSWRSFVAMGDSFTEGLDDPYPGGDGFRGWADLVAAALAAQEPAFRYANLAIRGRKFVGVADEQAPVALEMRPELASFAAGGNDVLRRSFDPEALADRFDTVISSLRGAGADVVLFRFIDISRRLPARRVVQPRVELLNEIVMATGNRHGAYVVDLWTDEEFHKPQLWSSDRLHLSGVGHRRVAAHVLATLGLTPDEGWLAAPQQPLRRSWPIARAEDARWAARYLAPWIKRRLTGASSGDQVTAKRPDLAPVTEWSQR